MIALFAEASIAVPEGVPWALAAPVGAALVTAIGVLWKSLAAERRAHRKELAAVNAARLDDLRTASATPRALATLTEAVTRLVEKGPQ